MTNKAEKIGVLGAGTMGAGIAKIAAQAGFQTKVYDISQEFVDKGLGRIRSFLQGSRERGKITAEVEKEILDRLRSTTQLEDFKGYDLIIEADIDPQNNNGIEWVRYRLNGTTLERGVATKVAGADPELSTAPNMVEYVSNVINNASAATMTSVRNSYPTMFPGNTPVPVFTYALEGGGTTPDKIREVNITLIVMSQDLDPKTGQPRVVTLTGHARRMNP